MFKYVIIGNSGVGKSSLLLRFTVNITKRVKIFSNFILG